MSPGALLLEALGPLSCFQRVSGLAATEDLHHWFRSSGLWAFGSRVWKGIAGVWGVERRMRSLRLWFNQEVPTQGEGTSNSLKEKQGVLGITRLPTLH